jgi:two-component system chemotaxis response regulator CheY
MRRILVVEDSVSARAFVRAVLESPDFAAPHGGCEVVEASSGFDAMRLLPRGPYDLIITDINMADINGLELIRFIRRSDHHRSTPLLIISTLRAEQDVERGLALGADAYLPKPFTPEQLRDSCGKLLAAAPSADAGRPAGGPSEPPPAGGAG